jgi:invasion protein IalB
MPFPTTPFRTMLFQIFNKSRLVPLLSVLVITACFVERQFNTPVLAEEAKTKAKAKFGPKEEPAAQPVRTETITYDVWTVNCRDTVDGRTRKVCSATLPIVMTQQNQQIPLGAWIIGRNNDGALVSVVQTPQTNLGVLIPKGIEFKIGNANPQTIGFSACNPQRCEAILTMNEAVTRDMLAAANDSAIITFWKADGERFAITIQSIKGIDKAISAIR